MDKSHPGHAIVQPARADPGASSSPERMRNLLNSCVLGIPGGGPEASSVSELDTATVQGHRTAHHAYGATSHGEGPVLADNNFTHVVVSRTSDRSQHGREADLAQNLASWPPDTLAIARPRPLAACRRRQRGVGSAPVGRQVRAQLRRSSRILQRAALPRRVHPPKKGSVHI